MDANLGSDRDLLAPTDESDGQFRDATSISELKLIKLSTVSFSVSLTTTIGGGRGRKSDKDCSLFFAQLTLRASREASSDNVSNASASSAIVLEKKTSRA